MCCSKCIISPVASFQLTLSRCNFSKLCVTLTSLGVVCSDGVRYVGVYEIVNEFISTVSNTLLISSAHCAC